MKENKQVYILSLEASDIFSHIHRGTNIKYDYCGMIPYSLELIKLKKEGFKTKLIKSRGKEISNDIINVKFNQKVKSWYELRQILNETKKNNLNNKKYVNKIDEFLKVIDSDKNNGNWNEINVNELRKNLYTNGFKIKYTNPKTKKVKETEYVVYKRSSSKSRTGQCLFIKKSLYSKMIKWSRMDLPLKKNTKIDLAGLLAYESLVGSSLEEVIKIDPTKILMVSDVNSKFNLVSNVVRKGKDEFLDSFKEKKEVCNSLFDGESLLDKKYFEDGIAMKLLRNHMFKSAAFNTNIQEFLKDNCPKGIEYEDWKINDLFGNKIHAINIEMICTPSSLKAFKFSKVIGNDYDMWEYWKNKVKEEGSLFGVCKHDKCSKFGEDEHGNILQQTSYQMINCLPIIQNDIKELIGTEKEYIERLKNDDEFFIKKVEESANLINSNEMLSTLYKRNNKIIHTKLFRKFRKDFIWNHMNHAKKGKIKLKGDYCVMLGNPMEFLYHAVGQLDIQYPSSISLKYNEIYTTLFNFNKKLVGFRNPNTSPSNVLVAENTYNEDIDTYFNLTNNIVCVNAIDFPIQDILSGCDYDSDTLLLFDDEKLLELGKKCFENYLICINDIEGQKKEYRLNKHDMYEIDNQLSTSQRNIGKVVNLGQLCMSTYWDLINNGDCGEHVDELLKKVDVMTILSGIAIDMAKKFYEIDIDKEIYNVANNEQLKKRRKKPDFWRYVSQSKTIKNRVTSYNCPMDMLIQGLDEISKAIPKGNIRIEEIIDEIDTSNANYKQFDKIIKKITDMDNEIKNENAKYIDKDEKFSHIEDITKDIIEYINKLKISNDTLHLIIKYVSNTDINTLRMFNILFQTNREEFINSFKNGQK